MADTSKATAGKIRAKHQRWAAEMREAGWGVLEPEKIAMPLKDVHWTFEGNKK